MGDRIAIAAASAALQIAEQRKRPTLTDAEIVEMLAREIRGEFAGDAAWKCLAILRTAGVIGDGR